MRVSEYLSQLLFTQMHYHLSIKFKQMSPLNFSLNFGKTAVTFTD